MNLPPPPDGTVSQLFPLAFQLSCLWAFVSRHWEVYKGMPHLGIHYLSMSMYCLFLCYSFIWASSPLFCLLCVSFWTVPLAQTWGNCWLFGVFFLPCYLVLLDHPILLLFWRGLPGDDDGSPIVPTLCHCNLTRRGTGGWGGRQKKKNVHIW